MSYQYRGSCLFSLCLLLLYFEHFHFARADEPTREGDRLLQEAAQALQSRELDRASALAKQALRWAEEHAVTPEGRPVDDLPGMVLNIMGVIAEQKRAYERAEEYYTASSVRCYTSTCAQSAKVNLATLFFDLKKYDKMDNVLRPYIDFFLENKHDSKMSRDEAAATRAFVGDLLVRVSERLENAERYDLSEWYYQRLIDFKRKYLSSGDISYAVTFYNFALMLKKSGQIQKAVVNAKYALELEESSAREDTAVDKWRTLCLLGNLERHLGQNQEAESHLNRAVLAIEKSRHDDGPMVNFVFLSLSELYQETERESLQMETLQREVRYCERQFGTGAREVAEAHNHLAEALRQRGRWNEALVHAQQALAIAQQKSDTDRIGLYSNLVALILSGQGKHELAVAMLQRLLVELERTKPNSPQLAMVLTNLGETLAAIGQADRAIGLLQRALAIWSQLSGANASQQEQGLVVLATVFVQQRRWSDAEPLLVRAYQLRKSLASPNDARLQHILKELTELLTTTGKESKRVELIRRHLADIERVSGKKGTYYAMWLARLARSLSDIGLLAEAEQLAKEVLALSQESSRTDVATLSAMGTEATTLQRMGQLNLAIPLFEKVLTLAKQSGVAVSVESAQNNLALAYWEKREYDRAQELLQEAIASVEQRGDVNGHNYGVKLNNLGIVLIAKGDYQLAEKHLRKAVAIGEKALGPLSPQLTTWRDNLAACMEETGHVDDAVQMRKEVLALYEKSLGPEHPESLPTAEALAFHYAFAGRTADFVAQYESFLRTQEKVLRELRTEQRLGQFLMQLESRDGLLVGMAALTKESSVRRLALASALLHKGRTMDLEHALRRVAASGINSSGQKHSWLRLRKLYSRLDTLLWSGVRTDSQKEQLEVVRKQVLAEEVKLGARAMPLRQELPGIEQIVPAVASALPHDGVLIEIVTGMNWQRNKAVTPTMAYIGLVLFPDQHIEVVNMGPVDVIDRTAITLLEQLRNPSTDPVRSAQKLYQLVLAPFAKVLKKQRTLIVAPEGALHLIPWAAMHDGKRYLIDSYGPISYVTSGRDLLRTSAKETRSPPLVVGAPNYQLQRAESQSNMTHQGQEPMGLYALVSAISPLPFSRKEAQQVATMMPNARILLEDEATETNIRSVRGPHILHIATHGLFAPGEGRSNTAATFSGSRALIPHQSAQLDLNKSTSDPLSRAALLFAGAAKTRPDMDRETDGILTAQEASSLDMFGTEMVVLSACDTGTGSLEKRQGVYGLRRAFMLAGARTLVVSLWQVADAETSALMTEFYRGLLAGRGRSEAMAAAATALRKRKPHPYYWAPFLVVGSSAPIQWDRPFSAPAIAEVQESETDPSSAHPYLFPASWPAQAKLQPSLGIESILAELRLDVDTPPIDNVEAGKTDATTSERLSAQIKYGLQSSRYYAAKLRALKARIDAAERTRDASTITMLSARRTELLQRQKEWAALTTRRIEQALNDPALKTAYQPDQALTELTELYLQLRQEQHARDSFKRLLAEFPQSVYLSRAYLLFADWFLPYTAENSAKFALKAASYNQSPLSEAATYLLAWASCSQSDYKAAMSGLIDVMGRIRESKKAETTPTQEFEKSIRAETLRALEVAAKSDLVAIYAKVGLAEKALPFFQKYGREDAAWMLVQLGSLFLQLEHFTDSTTIFKALRSAFPNAAPEVRCAWQEELVQSLGKVHDAASLLSETSYLEEMRSQGLCL